MPQFAHLLAGISKFLDVPALHDLPSILPTWQGWGHWPEWPAIEFAHPWVLNLGFNTQYPVTLLLVPVLLLIWSRSQPAVGHSRLPPRRKRWYGPLLSMIVFVCVLAMIGAGSAGSIIAVANLSHHGYFSGATAYGPSGRFQADFVLAGFSLLSLLSGTVWAWRSSRVATQLLYLSTAVFLTLLLVIVAIPKKWDTAPGSTISARDIGLVLDISTNVKEATSSGSVTISEDNKAIAQGVHPSTGCGAMEDWGLRKLDAQAYVSCKIVEALPADRFFVATFDGSTYCCAPELTHDHKQVFRQLQLVNQHIGDSSTNFDGGGNASIGTPGVFQVILDYIEKNAKSGTKVFILATDGDGTIQQDRLEEFANRIKKLDVMVIFLGAGPDTVAYDPDSDTLVQLGHDPRVNALITDPTIPANLQKVIDLIKSRPPTEIKLGNQKLERPIHEPFILLALMAFACSALLSARLSRIR